MQKFSNSNIKNSYKACVHVIGKKRNITLSNLVDQNIFPNEWMSALKSVYLFDLDDLFFMNKEELIALINEEKRICSYDRMLVLNNLIGIINSKSFNSIVTLLKDYYSNYDVKNEKFSNLLTPIKYFEGDLENYLSMLGLKPLSELSNEKEKQEIKEVGLKNFLSGGINSFNGNKTILDIISAKYNEEPEIYMVNLLKMYAFKLENDEEYKKAEDAPMVDVNKVTVKNFNSKEDLVTHINFLRDQIGIRKSSLVSIRAAIDSYKGINDSAQYYINDYHKLYNLHKEIESINSKIDLLEAESEKDKKRLSELKETLGISQDNVDTLLKQWELESAKYKKKLEEELMKKKQEKEGVYTDNRQVIEEGLESKFLNYQRSIAYKDWYESVDKLLKKETLLEEEIVFLEKRLNIRIIEYQELENDKVIGETVTAKR